jgi:hypothetical protein
MSGIPDTLTEFQIVTALDYATGTASRNGAIIDMLGFRNVFVVVHFATIAGSAAGDVRMQDGAAANLSDAADLLGSAIAVVAGQSNQIVIVSLHNPVKRYCRVVVTKDASHAMAESAIYFQYGAQQRPVTVEQANLVNVKTLRSPIDGTA